MRLRCSPTTTNAANARNARCITHSPPGTVPPHICTQTPRPRPTTSGRWRSRRHRALAEALFRATPSDWRQAEDAIRTAIQLQQEVGARPELARSYVSYSAMLAERGEQERSRELLAKATDLIRELGMVTWDLERRQEPVAR